MSQMTRPANAPGCWGAQFTDGDRECIQCPYQDSCRSTCMNRAAAYNPPAPPTFPSTTMVPLPTRTMLPTYPPPPPAAPVPVPVYRPPQPVVVQPHGQAQPQPPVVQYQASPGYIPDPNNLNPLMPMIRPGVQGPPYYFGQYPGETIKERLAKNVILRAAEAFFQELVRFFGNWTWPKKS